jgi:hypothetical protein
MKRFQLVSIMLFALLGFGVLTAASASAATFLLAEWLDGGAAIGSELLTELEGSLLLEDTVLKAAVLCTGDLDGWVGSNSLGWVSEVLTVLGEEVNTTPLDASGLKCTAQAGCAASPSPMVWAVNLGWETEVELMEDSGTFFADLILRHSGGSNPGWEVECSILDVLSDDICVTPEAVVELTLEGTTLLGNFSEPFTELAGAKLGLCTFDGGETGVVEGGGAIVLVEGGELTASSEGVVS